MLWTSAKRIFRSGFVSFWRNFYVSLASIFVLAATLFVIGGLILAAAFLKNTLTNIEKQVDISVSFKTDAPESDILVLKRRLTLLPTIKTVTYRSRDQERADFVERHKDNALIIQSLEEVGNPFGARLNIEAVDPAHYGSIEEFLKSDDALAASGQDIIDHVSYKKDIIGKLVRVLNTTRKVGLAVSLALILISVLVTINTISLAIYTAREEISVMRLVGGGGIYVKGPFVVQGALAGIIATLVALALLYPATLWLRNAVADAYGGIDLVSYYLANLAQIFLILLGAGVGLGVVASYLAARKYITT